MMPRERRRRRSKRSPGGAPLPQTTRAVLRVFQANSLAGDIDVGGPTRSTLLSRRIMADQIIYLDTNHISGLARNSGASQHADALSVLRSSGVRIAFSVLHMVELSDPAFKSFADVCGLLDSLSVAWAILPTKLFDREVEAAVAVGMGAQPPRVRAFFETPAAALNYPALERGLPSAALEAMRENPELRRGLLDLATDHAREYDLVKTWAAAVERPLEPLLARIRAQQIRTTPSGIHLLEPFPPELILERAGGLSACPAYEVYQSLNVTRLRDPKYRTVRNTIMDEWHAAYTPYVSVMALDKATARRFRSTRLPVAERVAERIDEIPSILARGWTEPMS